MTDPVGGTTRLSFVARLGQHSNAASWVHFHKYYGEMLYGYARRLGASHETAEDVVQEVEMYVFRAIHQFRHQSRRGCFRAYLRAAVVHALARQTRREARHEMPLDPGALETLARTDALEDPAWQRERYLDRLRWALRSVVNEFEASTIEAFRLSALAGRPAGEVASLLGMSRDCVYQAKSRVLRRLRERLGVRGIDCDLRTPSQSGET